MNTDQNDVLYLPPLRLFRFLRSPSFVAFSNNGTPNCIDKNHPGSPLGQHLPHVIVEVLLAAKSLGTEGAGVRHIPRVLPDMVVQVLLPAERFRAVGALVWSLARVLAATQNVHSDCFISLKKHSAKTVLLYGRLIQSNFA